MLTHTSSHKPVLLDEVVASLCPSPEATLVDATFGAGGYSRRLLAAVPQGRVIALDRDPAVAAAGAALAAEQAGRFIFVPGRFGDLARLLNGLGVHQVDGIVADIGVSSMQIDQPERGFSFRQDGPLDMRMGDDGPTAATLLAAASEAEIADILWRYGEERRARAIARAIVHDRTQTPFTRTAPLAELVRRVARAGARGTQGRREEGDGGDPAARAFQALRIWVNDELGELERLLAAIPPLLAPGGRAAIVTFHSLEDRMVKTWLRTLAGRLPAPSRHLPPERGETLGGRATAGFAALSSRPVRPGEAELADNPRARSARLRTIIRLPGP